MDCQQQENTNLQLEEVNIDQEETIIDYEANISQNCLSPKSQNPSFLTRNHQTNAPNQLKNQFQQKNKKANILQKQKSKCNNVMICIFILVIIIFSLDLILTIIDYIQLC
ncbi:hypothetical protein ABPG72_012056 [Tetrahymena utriculariae]